MFPRLTVAPSKWSDAFLFKFPLWRDTFSHVSSLSSHRYLCWQHWQPSLQGYHPRHISLCTIVVQTRWSSEV